MTIRPKDVFGIKQEGQKFKLVNASDVSTVFYITAQEDKLLVQPSRGFRGKVNGTKVRTGSGGLDSPSGKHPVSAKPR